VNAVEPPASDGRDAQSLSLAGVADAELVLWEVPVV